MKKVKTVEELAKENLGKYEILNGYEKFGEMIEESYIEGHSEGFRAGQAALLERTSESFDEAWDKHGTGTKPTGYERAIYQAATLAAEKRHQKEREEMLNDMEWLVKFVREAWVDDALKIRAKWFGNTKE